MARKTRRHRMAVDWTPTTKITGVGVTAMLATALTVLTQEWFGVEISTELAVGGASALITLVGYLLPRSPDQPE